MKKIDTASLRKSIMYYVSLSMLVFALITALSTFFYQQHIIKQKEQEYNTQIHASIEHAIEHYLRDYTYKARRISQTTELPELLKQKNREAVYKLLKPKWDSLNEEEPCLNAMNIHSSDGTSFLRVHLPDIFGDKLSHIRPMIKEAHSLQKPINGYEAGIHQNAYRIIYPIFDESKKYLGAIELGLNPNFILKEIREINNFKGLLFIENGSMEHTSAQDATIIEGYKLQSTITDELEPILKELKKLGALKENSKISTEGKSFLTHLFVLNDFKNIPKVKIIVFQDFLKEALITDYFLFGLFLFILIFFLLLMLLIYRRINLYQEDVSQIYKEHVKELNESERYLRAIFNVNKSIMITTDGSNIDRANPAMLEFFGFKTIENFKLEHNCICDYFLKDKNCLHAIMGELTWLEYILKRDNELHKVHMMKNGKTRHFLVWAKLLNFDEKHRAVVVLTDITEFEEIKERLEYAVNGTNDGLWDWNLETDELYLSGRFKSMLGYRDDELTNKPETLFGLIDPDDLNNVKNTIEVSCKSSAVPYEVIFRMQHKDTHWLWILSRAQVIFDEKGKAVRIVGFHTDISDIKKLEQELIESEELMIAQSKHAAMGEMIGMIAHQWRQPITTIAMDANNILADIELESLDNDVLNKTSRDIIHQTQELSKTIDDFRNFFKPEKAKEEVLVTDVFMDSDAIINKSMQNNAIEVENIFDSKTKVSIYSRELLQVFINLLKNAKEALVEHKKDERKITNKIYETQKDIVIEICDNGGGIEDKIFKKLFQPYFTTKDEKNGTGLGLYMSKTIIEKHLGGKISVENVNDDKGVRVGACFKIEIPKEAQQNG